MPDYSFYTIYLKTLVKSSTKLKKLEKILANMQGRSDEAMAKGETKEKIVCTTAHPAALGLLYQAIKIYMKDFNVVIISALMDIAKQT